MTRHRILKSTQCFIQLCSWIPPTPLGSYHENSLPLIVYFRTCHLHGDNGKYTQIFTHRIKLYNFVSRCLPRNVVLQSLETTKLQGLGLWSRGLWSQVNFQSPPTCLTNSVYEIVRVSVYLYGL